MHKKFNTEQKKACFTVNGRILVLAGAGSGKTSVLTQRILHLISQYDVSPEAILGLTFTNKAAAEMRARITKQLGKTVASKIPLFTFHSFCLNILKKEIHHLGYTSSFTLYDEKDKLVINQWLMAQMGLVGPMIGQHHQFHHYNPGKSEFGENRYFEISKRIYKDLDERLGESKYLAGNDYTIADIATFPWIARHEWHDIGLKKFLNLSRWYKEISKRNAVIKGYDLLKRGEQVPKS